MNKNFASYEISKKLMQLGVELPYIACYTDSEKALIICNNLESNLGYKPAFLYEDIFRWFRDEHRLMAYIYPGSYYYTYEIFDLLSDRWIDLEELIYKEYQYAQEACIKWLLDFIIGKETRSECSYTSDDFPLEKWNATLVSFPT